MKEELKKINIMKKYVLDKNNIIGMTACFKNRKKSLAMVFWGGGVWGFVKRHYFEYVETHDENNYYTLTCAFNVMRDMF